MGSGGARASRRSSRRRSRRAPRAWTLHAASARWTFKKNANPAPVRAAGCAQRRVGGRVKQLVLAPADQDDVDKISTHSRSHPRWCAWSRSASAPMRRRAGDELAQSASSAPGGDGDTARWRKRALLDATRRLAVFTALFLLVEFARRWRANGAVTRWADAASKEKPG